MLYPSMVMSTQAQAMTRTRNQVIPWFSSSSAMSTVSLLCNIHAPVRRFASPVLHILKNLPTSGGKSSSI